MLTRQKDHTSELYRRPAIYLAYTPPIELPINEIVRKDVTSSMLHNVVSSSLMIRSPPHLTPSLLHHQFLKGPDLNQPDL